jgi:hypothetical protein
MRRSGYSGRYRKRVLEAALGIYRKKLKDDMEGRKPLYRSRNYLAEQRRIQKETERVRWYRRGKGSDKLFLAPLIVDPTPGGELTRKFKEVCEETARITGIRIKVVERGGSKIKSVCKSNPLATVGCKRKECGVCEGRNPGLCQEISAGYSCQCLSCEVAGITSRYEGETGQNCYTRQEEHDSAVQKGNLKNAFAKHCEVQHEGEKAEFNMKVTGIFRSCIERQNNEAVRVRKAEKEADILMNSRTEFHQPPISRVVVFHGNRQEEQISQTVRQSGRRRI